MISAARTLPVAGALVSVPFTSRGTQFAVVLGYTPAGRMKVHPFNRAARMWSGAIRTIDPAQFADVFPVAWAAAGLDRTRYEDAMATAVVYPRARCVA